MTTRRGLSGGFFRRGNILFTCRSGHLPFQAGFQFQLTADEKAEVVAVCDYLRGLKFSPVLPHAFTEHGAVMLASVLNSERAVQASIFVVRAFNRLKQMLASHTDLARKLDALEAKYDTQFRIVFDAIRELMEPPPEPPEPRIGFDTEWAAGPDGKLKRPQRERKRSSRLKPKG